MSIVPCLFGLYSLWLGADANWDLYNYHLYNAFAWLHGKLQTDLAPAGLQSYFNPLIVQRALPSPPDTNRYRVLLLLALASCLTGIFCPDSAIQWATIRPRCSPSRAYWHC
jgi:hypothetical protein